VAKEQRRQATYAKFHSIEQKLDDIQQRVEGLAAAGERTQPVLGVEEKSATDVAAGTAFLNSPRPEPPPMPEKLHKFASFQDTRKSVQMAQRHSSTSGFLTRGAAAYETGGVRGFVKFLVADSIFEAFCAVAIVCNSISIGVELDWTMHHPNASSDIAFQVMNTVFVIMFTLEVLLRWAADGSYFISLRNPDLGWNIFDFTLVASSLIEEALGGLANMSITALRIVRTLRLARSLRIIRVLKVFKDLRIMMAGIMHSLQSLIWAGLLLLTIMYVVSICVLQFASDEFSMRERDPNASLLSDAEFFELKKLYADLPTTIYTLFRSISGGLYWNDAAQPLFELHSVIGGIFVWYVSFSFLCVLNIVTGVLVNNAQLMVSQDEEVVFMEQMEERRKWLNDVEKIFETADTNHTGFLNRSEFAAKMQDAQLQAWLRKIGIHVDSYTLDGLFDLLDVDGDGFLDLDEFAISAQTMQGTARAMDVAKIHKDTKTLRKDIALLLKLVGSHSHGTPRGGM